MKVFKNYSYYYNLLYKDKNYKREADFVDNAIKKYSMNEIRKSASILDLGCGTGKHDFELIKKGYQITGVDVSKDMLNVAKNENEGTNDPKIKFILGDIRGIRLHRKFNIVISLFHVINYMVENKDLLKMLKTVNRHLKPEGLFVFDYWYGPGVLTDKPGKRIKRYEDGYIKIKRKATPKIYPNNNTVDVNYLLEIQDKKTGRAKKISETHKMRYLFIPELEYFLNNSGLKIIHSAEWLTDKKLGFDAWNGYIVATNK